MKHRIVIRKGRRPHETWIEVDGSTASLSLRIRNRSSARERRTIGLAFFRQIRPFLSYFRDASVIHSEDSSSDYLRIQSRGLYLPASSDFDCPTGKLGFVIRMRRLELGWTQSELARLAGINLWQVSRIERGACHPHPSTLKRLEIVLSVPLSLPARKNAKKVKLAQAKVLRRADFGGERHDGLSDA